jgi:hypothetical protein
MSPFLFFYGSTYGEKEIEKDRERERERERERARERERERTADRHWPPRQTGRRLVYLHLTETTGCMYTDIPLQ